MEDDEDAIVMARKDENAGLRPVPRIMEVLHCTALQCYI